MRFTRDDGTDEPVVGVSGRPGNARPTALNPYRDAPLPLVARMTRLERENGELRTLVAALFLVSMLLAGAAAWWGAILWRMTR